MTTVLIITALLLVGSAISGWRGRRQYADNEIFWLPLTEFLLGANAVVRLASLIRHQRVKRLQTK